MSVYLIYIKYISSDLQLGKLKEKIRNQYIVHESWVFTIIQWFSDSYLPSSSDSGFAKAWVAKKLIPLTYQAASHLIYI